MSKKEDRVELLDAMDILEKEKGIKKEVIIEALKDALANAYQKNYEDNAANVEVEISDRTGEFKVYAAKTVVEEVTNDVEEISLADALRVNRGYELGDIFKEEVTPRNFGRLAAQTAKSVVLQKLRDEERNIIFDKYNKLKDDLVEGEVSREDERYIYVNLGDGVEAAMNKHDQMPNEHYRVHDRIQVYVTRVNDKSGARGPLVFVSRTSPDLLKRLFEKEVPEIQQGIVEVRGIVREAGDRAKVAVFSRDENVDPVGTCVGPRGARVQAIVNQLGGENIDIVKYEEAPEEFIRNALNPAEVEGVLFDENNGEVDEPASVDENGREHEERIHRGCTVIVPDDQLSLAIGKRGQNVRLAAQLTGYKIDIKSSSQAAALEEAQPEPAAEVVEQPTQAPELDQAADSFADED
ncbi:transcription termination factor NusA [Limosilactobacillus fermentum]|uniref:Transcription termination/antitermination protein NusA n=1 Tax=Limosilactobacillus fermentum TaxID=1613 RepID=A0ABD0AID6_LIMFE|nr:transcription termination factor NusA [Limosilactobacillus fermentum]PHI33444.1 transcription termination/antitermination protein NusA [Limosilactobacillus fermentum]UVF12976.1 transcription termination factor NusA [Limosilactobacillus fermentum]WRQ25028.1 transcription termination factor NusA [Limosilactobacillus fermentum]SJM48403.1 Transcription termination protein NusA [Limosilactobacillus fermentum]SJM57016.1 Transcription termination protein NusA [Limosilactobacillus fermentum]